MTRAYDPIKRVLDLVVASIMIVVLVPVYLVIALGVALGDGLPVFYGQMRIGQGGRTFRLWKFRSMVSNAASIGGYQTVTGDPRITGIGRILRKTSLDELPQLWNVVAGDMSLVGPRPDTPEQRTSYSDQEWRDRTSVRPGITGLAQVIYKRRSMEKTRTELDLDYVAERSFGLDLKIIWMTLTTVLKLKNE